MNDARNDPLDDLLAQARWPAATPRTTQRLVRRWVRLRSTRRITLWWISAAAAAVVVIAVAVTSLRKDDVRPAIVLAPAEQATVLPGREPTARELILLRMAERAEARAPTARTVGPPEKGPRPLPPAAMDEVALVRVIQEASGRVSVDVAKEFSRVATARSLPLVLMLARDAKLRPVMGDAIVRLGDVDALAALIADSSSSHERRKFIAAMLNRHSPRALPRYLELVVGEATRSDALAALDDVQSPPVEQLMLTLRGPRADLRLAAAWALGRIDGPVLTHRLIQMIDADENRREAFIALAASRGSDAQAYLRQAAASRRFSSLARSAIAQTNIQPNFRSQS